MVDEDQLIALPRYKNFFRWTKIGNSLQETLTDLIENGELPADMFEVIMKTFEETLHDTVFPAAKNSIAFYGHIQYYRNYKNIWVYSFDKVMYQVGTEVELLEDGLKVITYNPNYYKRKQRKCKKKKKRGKK
ncbi:hypothetical protein ACOME3_007778 [Neoechinorhynchus agilis]